MFKKHLKSLAVALIMALVVTMFIPVQKAEASSLCSQPAIYSNKIVVDVSADAYPSYGTVYKTNLDVRVNNGDFTRINSFAGAVSQVEVSGISTAYQYDVRLTCEYESNSGHYDAEYPVCTLYDASLAPVKVTGLKQDAWYSSGSLYTIWKEQASVTGYQYQLYNAKNKCIKKGTTKSYSPRINFNKLSYQTYKMRVRAYTTFNGSNRYGAWSGWLYIVPPTKNISGKSAKKKSITVKWSKVTGATSYTIFVSTKAKSGYKATKTVSAKTTKATIKKIGKSKLKSKKTYYVYVRPNKKVSGKNKYSTFKNAYITYIYGKVK